MENKLIEAITNDFAGHYGKEATIMTKGGKEITGTVSLAGIPGGIIMIVRKMKPNYRIPVTSIDYYSLNNE